MSDRIVDAVVIGAGHHGLVAAALLAAYGLSRVAPAAGGALLVLILIGAAALQAF